MKIGLFGGSFNPVHSTHIDVAEAVMKRLGLDKVLLVPAGNPYHKGQGDMLPAELRYDLIQKAVAGHDKMEACDIDMRAEGPTFTVDTLQEAARRYPDAELYFIMGQDAFNSLPEWKDWNRIPVLANVVAVSREEADNGEMARRVVEIFPDVEKQATSVWNIKGGKSIYIIGDFDFVISSTLVRETWKKDGDISSLVPEAVARCITDRTDLIKKYWDN